MVGAEKEVRTECVELPETRGQPYNQWTNYCRREDPLGRLVCCLTNTVITPFDVLVRYLSYFQ